jgi:hypothetical protein
MISVVIGRSTVMVYVDGIMKSEIGRKVVNGRIKSVIKHYKTKNWWRKEFEQTVKKQLSRA